MKTKLPAFIGVLLASSVTTCVLWFVTQSPARSVASRVGGPVRVEQVAHSDTEALTRRINALQEELVRMRAETRAGGSAAVIAVASALATPPAASAQPEVTPEEEARQDAIVEQFYSDLYAADVPDPGRAREFEQQISEAIAATGHTQLKGIECRATVCRLELKHADPRGRTRFYELGYGPLKYGWHFDASKSASDETVAIVGMPGHPLPTLPQDEGAP